MRAATIREMPIPSWHMAETARAGAQIQREPVRTALSWLVAVSFVILAVTTVLAFVRPPVPAEVSTLTWIRGSFGGSLDGLMRFLDEAGSVAVMSPAFVALAAALLLAGRRRPAVAAFAGGAAALLVNIVIKTLVSRPRPDLWAVEVDSIGSYPSGHTLFVTVFFGLLVVLLRGTRWRGIALGAGVVVCLVMAFSRLYLGEHFPSDVVASLALGVLIVSAVERFIGLSASQHPAQ